MSLITTTTTHPGPRPAKPPASSADSNFFCGRRPLPFGGSHLRLPSGPAGIRTTTGSLSALARPTPYQLSHRVAFLCGQQASLQLPTAQILPLLEALQKRLGIDPSNAELAINEVLASHADPQYTEWKIIIMDNTAWQLNPTDPGSLDVQCTGLGGGELDQQWDVLLACRKEAHVSDHLSASRTIGMQELAQSQEPPTPKNTCCCI